MLTHIVIGVALLVATTSVHSVCTWLSLRTVSVIHARELVRRSVFAQVALIAGLVVLLFFAALFESTLWAWTYLAVGALGTFEEAFYFSNVTFSTLGFGDLTLGEDWRLLSSFQAANGTILFGWSTALVFALVQAIVQVRASEQGADGRSPLARR